MKTADERLRDVEALLPTSFFSDRNLEFRVEHIVDDWRKLVRYAQKHEDDLLKSQMLGNWDAEKEKEEYTARCYFIDTGKEFSRLDPVTRRKLIEAYTT